MRASRGSPKGCKEAWRHQQKVFADSKAQLRKEHAEQLKGIMLEYLKVCPPSLKLPPIAPIQLQCSLLQKLGCQHSAFFPRLSSS